MANGLDFRELHAENGGHASHSNRHRLLHVLAAIAHRAHCVRETERSSAYMSRVLTQAVPADETRFRYPALQYAKCRYGSCEDRRLGDLGEPKLVLWALKTELGKFVAEHVIRFFESLGGLSISF